MDKRTGQKTGDTTTAMQFEELDYAIENCIKKFRDVTTGTGVRVLVAEFEELMFLRTKLLTQMVIAEHQEKRICKRFEYDSKPKVRMPRVQSLNNIDTEKSEEKKVEYISCLNRKTDRNSKIALGITAVTFLLLILAYLDEIVSFAHYVLSYLR